MTKETNDGLLYREASRRDALKIIGAFVFLAACSPNRLERPPAESEKEILKGYIEELPESKIKDVLSEKVIPLLQSPRPASVNINGIDVPVYDVKITKSMHEKNEFSGTANLDDDPTSSKGVVTRDTDFLLPMPYIYSDLVNSNSSSTVIATPEDVYIIQGKLIEGQTIDDSIAPHITIKVPDTRKVGLNPQHFKEMEKSIYLKEALSIAFMLDYYGKIANEMSKIGVNPEVNAQSTTGKTLQVNTITNSINSLTKLRGRFTAVADIAGYYLLFKVSQNTPLENHLRLYPAFDRAIESIYTFSLNSSIKDPFQEAIRWAVNSEEARDLVFIGDLNKLP